MVIVGCSRFLTGAVRRCGRVAEVLRIVRRATVAVLDAGAIRRFPTVEGCATNPEFLDFGSFSRLAGCDTICISVCVNTI